MRKLIVMTAAAALLAAGCGGNSASPSGPSPTNATNVFQLVSDAVNKTVATHTAKAAITLSVSTPQGDASGTGEGAFDLQAKRGSMHFTMSIPGGQSLDFDILYDGTVLYERFPAALSSQLPGGKEWIRLDLQELSKLSGVDISQLIQSSPTDPTQTLEYLKAASSDIQSLGTEDVRGIPTRHFHMTVDLNKIAGEQGLGDSIRSVIDLLGRSTFPMDVWIDDQGRARRTEVNFSFEPSQAGASAGRISTKETVEYFDFGAPVHVSIPPDSDVVDFSDVLSGLGQSQGSSGSSG